MHKILFYKFIICLTCFEHIVLETCKANKILWIKLVNYQDYTEMHSQQNIKKSQVKSYITMELSAFETSVAIYQSTQSNISEDLNIPERLDCRKT